MSQYTAPRLYEIGGQALSGDFFSTHYSAEDPDPQVQRFVSDYRRLFGTTGSSLHAAVMDWDLRRPATRGPDNLLSSVRIVHGGTDGIRPVRARRVDVDANRVDAVLHRV